MIVSVLIPFFKGNLKNFIIKAKKNTEKYSFIEYIITIDNINYQVDKDIRKILEQTSIKLYKNNFNIGTYKTQILNFNKSNGKYVILSSDDTFLNYDYLSLIEKLIKNNKNLDVCLIAGFLNLFKDKFRLLNKFEIEVYPSLKSSIINLQNSLISRKLALEYFNGQYLEFSPSEDFAFFLKILNDKKIKIFLLNRKFYLYKDLGLKLSNDFNKNRKMAHLAINQSNIKFKNLHLNLNSKKIKNLFSGILICLKEKKIKFIILFIIFVLYRLFQLNVNKLKNFFNIFT